MWHTINGYKILKTKKTFSNRCSGYLLSGTGYRASIKNKDQAIGAVGVHESVHAAVPTNIKESIENVVKNTSHDVEKTPNQVEMDALQEFFNKKNEIPIESLIKKERYHAN